MKELSGTDVPLTPQNHPEEPGKCRDSSEKSWNANEHETQQERYRGGSDSTVENFGKKSLDSNPVRRLSSQISKELIRRQSSVAEQLPDTPHGWAAFLTFFGSVLFGYELALQRRLTGPPTVYGQVTGDKAAFGSPLPAVYAKLTSTPDSILSRPIRPSLLVGTRGTLSSVAAYFAGGPKTPTTFKGEAASHSRNFRQVMTMTQDGAKIAIDWELPEPSDTHSEEERIEKLSKMQSNVIHGPIPYETVVVILHGINNDASFGYVRSLMRACTNRGWLACGFNFRGCGKQSLATPRSYTGAYTGDIRNVVWQIGGKLTDNGKLFLVGHSLGANLVTKYLGEEGLSGTLPKCVAGGVSLGNPLSIRSDRLSPLISPVMALGAKKGLIDNWSSIRHMKDFHFRQCIKRALLAPMLHRVDAALAPIFPRNEHEYPFAFRIGYKDADAYWDDASSFIRSPHIPVPTMLLIAADDFLVFHVSRARIQFCLNNPNVLVVETKCGGHLGWQESPPDGSYGGVLGTSWSDVAVTDFIAAVLETAQESSCLQKELQDAAEPPRSRL